MRLLHEIRNIGPRGIAYRSKILAAPALKLDCTPLRVTVLAELVTPELTDRPAYANLTTAKEMANDMPDILSGNSKRWKLWHAQIYEQCLKLNYVDMSIPKKSRGKNTGLICTIEWFHGAEIKISAPAEVQPEYYSVRCVIPDDEHHLMEVIYPTETADVGERESYEQFPLRG